ncbi:MAG: hypothetical protein IPN71_03130 [Fibrobacteres bacterium]|nr:hypothetical protein [Fibrobacterota bacterium]
MRRFLAPLAVVCAAFLLYPAPDGLMGRWKRLPALEPVSAGGQTNLAIDTLRRDWATFVQQDTSLRTESVADPFRMAQAQSEEPRSKVRDPSSLGPPPERLWKATGRVGERAAVLSHPDGRVVVVAVGQAFDSASVVAIGPGGVELEDRGGRFVLRIP